MKRTVANAATTTQFDHSHFQGEAIDSITSINSAASDKAAEFSPKLSPVVER